MIQPSPRDPSWLDAALCGYLALPVLLFCGWFRWPLAMVLAPGLLAGWHAALAGVRWRAEWPSRAAVLRLAAIALGWTAVAGGGHFVYASTDWLTRSAVLRDLVVAPWPPAYGPDAEPLILRAPVGYYLPSALVGMVAGLRGADIALWLWTALGFALFLGAGGSLFPPGPQRRLAVAVLVGFGGLDLVGYALLHGMLPPPGEFIGWWAGSVQYSSNAELLFWVPNHALPAWIGTVLALRHWRRPFLARIAPMMAAAVPLWSPLAAIGLAPFFVAGIAWRRDGRALAAPLSGLPWLVAAALVARYVTLDAHAIPAGWLPHWYHDTARFLILYALFCLLQFGLLAIVLLRLGARTAPTWIALGVLLLLPLYRFGPSNDLPMRASIPALTVLALATVRPLAGDARPAWRVALAAILALGALGALQEPERAFLHPRWLPADASMSTLYRAQGDALARELPHDRLVLCNLSGRGDKDVHTIAAREGISL